MPSPASREKRSGFLHRTFETFLLLKGLNAGLELGSAVLFWFVKPGFLDHWVHILTASELAEDPHDLLANWILRASGHYSAGMQYFAFYYLLSHGLIKLVLVLLLWRGKPWAYPLTAGTLALFVAYLTVRWSHTHAMGLVLFCVFDLVMIWLTLVEYRRIRSDPDRRLPNKSLESSEPFPPGPGSS